MSSPITWDINFPPLNLWNYSSMKKLIYIIDIDGTIVDSKGSDYRSAKPFTKRIEKVNKLFDEGNRIVYWTARGATSGIDWYAFTEKQLEEFGCKYHELHTKKPHYNVWVDDKAVNAKDFFA